MRRVHTVLLLVVAVPIALVGSCAWQWGVFEEDVEAIPFEPIRWKMAADIGDHRTVRSQMIGDLLDRYDFRGWNRESVVELLGEPDWNASDSGLFPPWDSGYLLGLERGGAFSFDDEYLVFRFDSDDRVTDYRLTVT